MDKVFHINSPYKKSSESGLMMSSEPSFKPAPVSTYSEPEDRILATSGFTAPFHDTPKLKETVFVINSLDRKSGTPQNYVVPLESRTVDRLVAAKIKTIHLPNNAEYQVDTHNNTFYVIFGDGTKVPITITNGNYGSDSAIASAIQTAMDAAGTSYPVITVTSSTNTVGLKDISGGSTLTASVAAGIYTPTELASELKTALDAVSGSSIVYSLSTGNLYFKDNASSDYLSATISGGTYSGTELASTIETAMNAVTKTEFFTIASPDHQFDFRLIGAQSLVTVAIPESTRYSGASLSDAIKTSMMNSSNYEHLYTVTLGVNDTFKIKDYTGGSLLDIVLTAGIYTRSGLITEIETQMNAASLTSLYPVPQAYTLIQIKDMPGGSIYNVNVRWDLNYTGAGLAAAIQAAMNGAPLVPRIKIGTSNNDFIFKDVSTGSNLTATVASGVYTPADLATALNAAIAAHGSRASTTIINSLNKTFQIIDLDGYDPLTVTMTEGEYTGAGLATELQTRLNALTGKAELYTIDATNNMLYFDEGGLQLDATVATGTQYDGASLAAAIKTALEAAPGSTGTYTVTFDTDTDEFTIASSLATLNLLANTGVGGNDIFSTIGFTTVADFTGTTSYTSDDPIAGTTATYTVSYSSSKITIATDTGFYLDLVFGASYKNAADTLGYNYLATYSGAESYVAPNNLGLSVKTIEVSYNSTTGQYITSTDGEYLQLIMSTADIASTIGYSASNKTGTTYYIAESSGIFGSQSTFTVTYNGSDEFTIASNSTYFDLTVSAGLATIIGFDEVNTGGVSYASSSTVTGITSSYTVTYSRKLFSFASSGTYFDLDFRNSGTATLMGFSPKLYQNQRKYTSILSAEGTLPVISVSYDSGSDAFTLTSDTGYLQIDFDESGGDLGTILGFTSTDLAGASEPHTSDTSTTNSTATFSVTYSTVNRTFTIDTDQDFLELYPTYLNSRIANSIGMIEDVYNGGTSYVSDSVPNGVSPVYTVTYNSSTNKFTIATSASFLTLDFTVSNPATTTLGFTGTTFTGGTSYTSDSTTSRASQTFTVSASTATRSFTMTSGTAFGLDFTNLESSTLLGFHRKLYSSATSFTSPYFYNLSSTYGIMLDIAQMRLVSGTSSAIDRGTTPVFLEDSDSDYITLNSSHFPETYYINKLSNGTRINHFAVSWRHLNSDVEYNFHGLDHVITLILYTRESE